MLPNILLITCHDLGKHLGCYGQTTVNSPALDHLAQSGVLMDAAYCTAPQCSPSRSALHTGRHAHANGVMGLTHEPFNWRLKDGEKHMARLFQEAGYHTALVGEQHLTPQPEELGYHHVRPAHSAGEVAAATIDCLRQAAADQSPFYLEAGFVEAHRPYDWGGATPDSSLGSGVPPYIVDSPAARDEFAALQGAIRSLDSAVGDILQALEAQGLSHNTWVIFTADHGLAMPRAKGTLYDPGLGVALLMRWPAGGIIGGQRYSSLVSHVDLLPTLLQGLGLPLPSNLHGRSYWPLLRGEPYEENRAIFAEKTFHTAYEPLRGVRTNTHKLIANFEVGPLLDVPDDVRHSPIYPTMLAYITGQRVPFELYDLHNDPWETDNLWGVPDMAPKRRELLALLGEWMQTTEDPLLNGPIPSPFYRRTVSELRQPS